MVEKTTMELTSPIDGLVLHANVYTPEQPRAIVQIFHGMSEHKERYDELCNLLAKFNCVVLISDHRGHGESINESIPLGHFADNDGWRSELKDLNLFAKTIHEKYRNLPYFIIGHSMGSLLACSYLKRYEDSINGVILSGMPAYNPNVPKGRQLAKAICKLHGNKGHSSTLIRLTNTFNRTIRNPRTDFDWISYNTDNVDKYIDDPLCGFPFTNGGYFDLLDGMQDVFNNRDWRVLKTNLPILFMVGQDDSCADVPQGFQKSLDNLTKAGYANIEANVYENMRHEIFNENNRKVVYRDLLTWIDVQIKAMESIDISEEIIYQ